MAASKNNASEALQFILNSDNESSDQSSDETTDEESEEDFSPNLQDESLSKVSSLLLLLATDISQGRVDIYHLLSFSLLELVNLSNLSRFSLVNLHSNNKKQILLLFTFIG